MFIDVLYLIFFFNFFPLINFVLCVYVSLYSWRFPLPYCGNVNGECNSHGGNSSVNSEVEKVPLSEMTFVL